jgi:hypothetical protein
MMLSTCSITRSLVLKRVTSSKYHICNTCDAEVT